MAGFAGGAAEKLFLPAQCARYSETYRVEGEVKLASSAKSALGEDVSAPIVCKPRLI